MMMPYYDEIDLSQTKYDDNWKSKTLADDPIYTEDMQALDRWAHRCLEMYRNKAINAVFNEYNDLELKRRNRTREEIRLDIEETFGDELPEKVAEFKEYICGEAVRRPSINDNFDEHWMDEDLKQRGLYHPGMETMRQWLELSALSSSKKTCEKLREELQAEVVLEAIRDAKFYKELDAEFGGSDLEDDDDDE